MIEKFADVGATAASEFLDLDHISNSLILVSLLMPKRASESGIRRASESGH
jgi:hypothetical protein